MTADVSPHPVAVPALSLVSGSAHGITPDMDPRLQRLAVRQRQGQTKAADVSTGAGEVTVVARVTNVALWEGLSEVRVGATIGQADGDWLVTGRVPVARIGYVHGLPFVRSLKAGQPLRPTLHATTREMQAQPELLPKGTRSAGGAGVVVGIVDYGCDFAHHNFLTASRKTRLHCIWDQNGPVSAGSPFSYGRVYTRKEINAALREADPYAALGYGADLDPQGTHGTHVMDIAAGNGRGSGTAGVAPRADLIFVDVSHTDLPWNGPDVATRSFGDSVRLLEALQFIFQEAGDRPCVVNVSLGTNGGPHDGRTLAEMGIDALVSEKPNRAVVIAAANAYEDGIHASGQLSEGGTAELRWQIPVNGTTHDEMEIWYAGTDAFEMDLVGPDGSVLLTVGPGQSDALILPNGKVAAFVAHRLKDPNNGDNVIGIFLEAQLPGGEWTVRLRGQLVENGHFHAWIERDNVSPSRFSAPDDNTHTIGSISTGQETIVVGSYDGHKASAPLSWFSSAGPTRDGREKPELSAPGHAVLAARSRSGSGVVPMSGTSMAAPAVAGVVALALAEAHRRNFPLASSQLREIIVGAARRNPPVATGWHDRYGHGRLSASAALQAVIAHVLKAAVNAVPEPEAPPTVQDQEPSTAAE